MKDDSCPQWPLGSALARRVGSVLLNDPRDALYLDLLARLCIPLPIVSAMFLIRPLPWWLALLHFGVVMWLLGPFVTGFHDLNHGCIFKPQWRFLDLPLQWLTGTFMGSPPQSFYVHHVVMHHALDNGPMDLHTTMPYQRDSRLQFIGYWFRVFFCGPVIARWFFAQRRSKFGWQAALGEGSFWALVVVLGVFNAQATVLGLLVPLFLTRSLFILGNWAEHAFIDPAAPTCTHRSSIAILNREFNEASFFVGYHTAHHLDPAMHCADLATTFEQQREEYGRQDAIVFEGTTFPGVWWKLMRHDYAGLARMMVQLPNAPVRTTEERVAMLKHRLAPIPLARPSASEAPAPVA